MLNYIKKTLSYLWEIIPERVRTYVQNQSISGLLYVWNKLPNNVKLYLMRRAAMNVGEDVGSLSETEKQEVTALLDSVLNPPVVGTTLPAVQTTQQQPQP